VDEQDDDDDADADAASGGGGGGEGKAGTKEGRSLAVRMTGPGRGDLKGRESPTPRVSPRASSSGVEEPSDEEAT